MPWDHVRLHIAKRAPSGWTGHKVVLDGPALQQPRFSPDGQLHVVSDATDWWNIHEVDISRRCPDPFSRPSWNSVLLVGYLANEPTPGREPLVQLDRQWVGRIGQINESGLLEVECGLTEFNGIDTLDDGRVVSVAAGWESTSAVLAIDKHGTCEQLSDSHPPLLATNDVSILESITIGDASSEITHGFYFAPTNSSCLSSSELPPLLVLSHGGPTG